MAETLRREFDVDIDVTSRLDRSIYGTKAMVYNADNERVLPHPSGVYIEEVPIDPETGDCAFDYKDGGSLGFYKVDLLNNTVYDEYRSREEVLEAIEGDVDWSVFRDAKVVSKLPHIANHFDLVSQVSPKSIDELADVLALIRPGKAHLLDDYIKSPNFVRSEILYKKPTNKKANYFKKSHAISYAYMIICALRKISNTRGVQW